MPVNQGSNFNFNTSNPYNFDDWGGVGQSPMSGTRGTYAGPGGHMNFRYPSTVSYTSASDAGRRVFGMHQKAPRYMAIASGTSVNGQLSQLQSSGAWFGWGSSGRTTFRFQGDNTSYSTNSPGYIYPASPTNPPFVILDLQASVPGGSAPGVNLYLYHGQNAQLIRQMGFASDSGTTWHVYHAGFDGGSNISAWDFEPIAGGSNYQFDQVTQF
jgi:hypothetical protein